MDGTFDEVHLPHGTGQPHHEEREKESRPSPTKSYHLTNFYCVCLTPIGERVGNRVNLVIVTQTREGQKLRQELVQPRCFPRKMDGSRSKLLGLSLQPHNFVAFYFHGVRGPKSGESLDQAGAGTSVLDKQELCPLIALPLSMQRNQLPACSQVAADT